MSWQSLLRRARYQLAQDPGGRSGRSVSGTTCMRWRLLGAVLVATVSLGSMAGWAQQVPPPPEGMSFTTRLDHTAVWVGDQFHYVITVDHSPNYEFVLENLTKDNINMEPFQVFDVNWHSTSLQEGNQRLSLDLTLASFAASFSGGQESEQIPQYTLYYFLRDRSVGVEEAAAESLTVPGPTIGLRSTLPPDASDIRDAITVTGWGRWRWLLPYTGLACLLILMTGLGWESVRFIQSRKTRKGPDRRKAMESIHLRWAQGVPAEFPDPQTVMEFYNHSYHNLKEYLTFYLETPAEGLTAEEMQEEMQRRAANADLTQKVVNVLGTCERARYGRNGTELTSEAGRSMAQEMREILAFSS